MSADGTVTYDVSTSDRSLVQVTWVLFTALPDGVPFQSAEWADRTLQAVGTWGGATLAIEGSHDGSNWFTLSNAAGATPATFTANGMKTIIELPRFIRPNLTVVGVGAGLTVIMLARRANPMRT